MNGTTTLVGLMGWPLNYSLSPAMHTKAFAATKLNYAYVPLRVDPGQINSLEHAVQALKALRFRGINVTIPYKQSIICYLDRLSPASMRANTVNTVILDNNGLLCGDTTDGPGFMADLKSHGIDNIANMSVSIVGAGGCAYALAFALLENGCPELIIHNRSKKNAEALVDKANALLGSRARVASFSEIKHSKLVINCTPPQAVKNLSFHADQIIYDTNYMNNALNFKKAAEAANSRFISGIGMLLFSGALSFEIFTGTKAPIDVMRKAL